MSGRCSLLVGNRTKWGHWLKMLKCSERKEEKQWYWPLMSRCTMPCSWRTLMAVVICLLYSLMTCSCRPSLDTSSRVPSSQYSMKMYISSYKKKGFSFHQNGPKPHLNCLNWDNHVLLTRWSSTPKYRTRFGCLMPSNIFSSSAVSLIVLWSFGWNRIWFQKKK